MISRTGSSGRGFTLIEVMMAAAVLSLGAVMIYHVYFTLMDTFDYCLNYFSAVPSIEENVWQAEDELSRLGSLVDTATTGVMTSGQRTFPWSLSAALIQEAEDMKLHQVDAFLTLSMSGKRPDISRIGFASYGTKKE